MVNKLLAIMPLTMILLLIILLLVFILLVQQIRFAKIKKNLRNDAVKRSRAVLGGQMAEQVAPFLPNFPCNPSDARFIGKPVDFIAFPGLDEKNTVDEVLLIEVKTGNSVLSEREKEIKRAVKEGRVRYIEYRIVTE